MYFYCEKCKKQYALNSHSYMCECGGMFRLYKEPGEEVPHDITLGEHETPLLPLQVGKLEFLLKMESMQPTGSFKDRGAAAMINELHALGVKKIALDSAGNAGAAIAGYAAAAGMECHVYVPDDISTEKISQIEAYGADIVQVANGRMKACAAVKQNLGDAYYASHVYNPLFTEGVKSMAHELYHQLGGHVPDYVFVPVGNGTLLIGLYLGFMEIGRLPHFVAVQSSKCAPVYEAFHKLEPQPNPNIAVQDRLTPVSVMKSGDGRYVLDMGQNMVGWLRVKASGIATGDTLTLRFSETLNPDTTLYVANLRTAKQTDHYVSKGVQAFTWHPEFVYHGFRYVEVTGLAEEPKPEDFEGQVFYDKMDVTGTFECSDPVVNQVYKNAFWGIRGNYRGMPTDCPQRDERMGWFGDRNMGCYGESYVFDNHALYSKWLTDIEDTQLENGSLPDVAPPFWKIYSDNMTWSGALISVADMLYRRFGDAEPVKVHYAAMKKWLDYMREKYCVDGIMTKDRYGDWCMPPESPELIHSKDPARITDGAVLSTAFYYYYLRKMEEFAQIAGRQEDIPVFKAQAEESLKAAEEARAAAEQNAAKFEADLNELLGK